MCAQRSVSASPWRTTQIQRQCKATNQLVKLLFLKPKKKKKSNSHKVCTRKIPWQNQWSLEKDGAACSTQPGIKAMGAENWNQALSKSNTYTQPLGPGWNMRGLQAAQGPALWPLFAHLQRCPAVLLTELWRSELAWLARSPRLLWMDVHSLGQS